VKFEKLPMGICKEFIGEKTKALICRKGQDIFDITNPNYKTLSKDTLNIRTKDDRSIGYIRVVLRPDEYWSEFEEEKSNLYWRPDIVGLYIKPEFREKGLGSDAVQLIVQWAKESGFSGIDGNEVMMDKDLDQRLRFLERCGFDCKKDKYGLYSCAIDF